MKILSFRNWFVATGVAIFLMANAVAQDSTDIVVTNPTAPGENSSAISTPATSLPSTVSAPAPAMAGSVSQVLQLSQAKVSDGTIVNFIQNSSASYPLAASQIIYLKQQGVSDNVLNAMLNKHGAAPVSTTSVAAESSSTPNATVAPTVTYETVPSSTVYMIPDTQTYYYNNGYYGSYPYYYPPVSVSLGFGWGWHGGYGGFRGRGGWHH